MTAFASRVSTMVSPRVLLVLAMVVGVLGLQAGRGTIAYFTSSAAVTGNQFTAGTLTANASVASGSSSAITWTTSKGGTDCATTTGGTLITGQPFTPGTYCVGALTVQNTGNIDAYLRLRLVRTAGSTSDPDQALNNLLQITAAEYTSATCNTTNFAPTSESYPTTAPTGFTYLKNGAGTEIRNLGLSAITAVDTTFNAASTSNTAASYVQLLGTDPVDGSVGANTTAALAAGSSRTFCIAVLFPIGSQPSSNTTGDNTAQAGDNTYAFHAVLAQQSNR